jgi:predicted NBD/HSP70 family sugar kinase
MRTPNAWIDEVADSLLDLAQEIDGDQGQLTTIGLALPHIVDPRSGALKPPLTSPWDEIPDPARLIADRISDRIQGLKAPLRVIMDNDANLGALAESTYNFTDTDTLIYVQASESIGAGIIIGGRIFRGATGGAGELGHLVVEAGGRFCSCGKQGCLEAVIGAEALLDRARMAVGRRPPTTPATLDDLVTKASQGDPVCQGVLRGASHQLGLALGGICNILNPKVVIIGGAFGYPSASPFTLDSCESAIRSSALQANTDNNFTLSASRIAHAPAHGALILGLLGTSF